MAFAEIIAIVSALIAMASLAFNALIVRRQHAMAFEGLKLSLDSDVLAWGRHAVDAIADAERFAASAALSADPADARREQTRIALHLSALADQGRFYFPNIEVGDDHGREKWAAFRGHRPPIIHAMVFAHYAIKKFDLSDAEALAPLCALLFRCRRLVVSEIQSAIDPRRRAKAFSDLSEAKQDSVGASIEEAADLAADLEALHPGVLAEHNDRIYRHATVRAAKRPTSP